ncbi:MAG: 16S rRNA (adenine(1518)-N(6)/adenine(1519)-N(6))-dimethyltransferase RsmA [Pikeienuella sp.]
MSAAPDGLPPLRDVISAHGLSAKKSLGQNFLLDLNLTSRIARASGPLDGAQVIEVGPGPGGLTRALLQGGATVLAIERDARCLAALAEIAAHYPGRLEVVAADALDLDAGAEAAARGWARPRICANLPYNVGTELLIRWLTPPDWPPWWQSLTLMFQREVAERIVAQPGSKAYGRLSVLAQWRAEARLLFSVHPSAFTPPPKVTSAVVRLTPRPQPQGVGAAALERVVAAAFAQRRKMLRQALRAHFADPLAGLERAGIDPTRRAETLTLDEFFALAKIPP